jgi:hypothetical protein
LHQKEVDKDKESAFAGLFSEGQARLSQPLHSQTPFFLTLLTRQSYKNYPTKLLYRHSKQLRRGSEGGFLPKMQP